MAELRPPYQPSVMQKIPNPTRAMLASGSFQADMRGALSDYRDDFKTGTHGAGTPNVWLMVAETPADCSQERVLCGARLNISGVIRSRLEIISQCCCTRLAQRLGWYFSKYCPASFCAAASWDGDSF